jgi:hypothetical protein
MSQWDEWQLQFEQIYDGAYRYIDRCGEFIASVRQELGFMPVGVNPMVCDMDHPDLGLKLQASSEGLSLTSWKPSDSEDFILAGEATSQKAIELFQPFSVHQNRLTSRSCRFTRTMAESHELSTRFLNKDGAELADMIGMTPAHHETAWAFQSGTRQVALKMLPIALNVTAGERRLPAATTPKSVATFLERKERQLQSMRPPSYGLSLEISLVELQPIRTFSLREYFDGIVKYRERITAHLKK